MRGPTAKLRREVLIFLTQPGTETADRERLGDFYLYPIDGRTTIANAQTKQVSFLDVQGVAARKIYGREVGWLASDSVPVNVSSMISFSSSRDGGLGDALPAGTVWPRISTSRAT